MFRQQIPRAQKDRARCPSRNRAEAIEVTRINSPDKQRQMCEQRPRHQSTRYVFKPRRRCLGTIGETLEPPSVARCVAGARSHTNVAKRFNQASHHGSGRRRSSIALRNTCFCTAGKIHGISEHSARASSYVRVNGKQQHAFRQRSVPGPEPYRRRAPNRYPQRPCQGPRSCTCNRAATKRG